MTMPGLCECGCGEKTRVVSSNNASKGWVKGIPLRFINGHQRRGVGSDTDRMIEFVSRFWGNVRFAAKGECWIWEGAKDNLGYGLFYIDWRSNKKHKAHRISYELSVGEIPDGLVIDHLCSVPSCVNPTHLEPVTQAENCKRSGERKTSCIHGHPYSQVHVRKNGGRYCLVCARERDKIRRPKRMAA